MSRSDMDAIACICVSVCPTCVCVCVCVSVCVLVNTHHLDKDSPLTTHSPQSRSATQSPASTQVQTLSHSAFPQGTCHRGFATRERERVCVCVCVCVSRLRQLHQLAVPTSEQASSTRSNNHVPESVMVKAANLKGSRGGRSRRSPRGGRAYL